MNGRLRMTFLVYTNPLRRFQETKVEDSSCPDPQGPPWALSD
jgi:hypothetical protein